MDNASKALLLAGSILIAILAISFGVHMFRTSSVVVQNTSNDLLAKAIMNYNQRYLYYIGNDVKSSDAKSLINLIDRHNSNKEEVANYGKIDKHITTDASAIVVGKTYRIQVVHYSKQGAITGISIEPN